MTAIAIKKITVEDKSLTIGKTTWVIFEFTGRIDFQQLIDNGGFSATHGLLSNFETVKTATGLGTNICRARLTPTDNLDSVAGHITVDLAKILGTGKTLTLFHSRDIGLMHSDEYTVDTRRPTATITLNDTALVTGETTTVTFAFSEPVTGFTRDDVVLTNANGVLGPLTASADGKTWSATFTPTAKVDDATNTISMKLGRITDAAGNTGLDQQVTSANYTIDTLRPAPTGILPGTTVALADTTLKAGQSTTVSFVFSEPVTGFTLDDVVLTNANGTLGPLTADADGKTWRATFTPTAEVGDATNTISVDLSGVTNAAGNTGTGQATSGNYTIDTRRPTATVTLADIRSGEDRSSAVTFTFSESVTGFTRDDIVLTDANGTLGELRADDADGKIWRAIFTPTPQINDDTNTIGVNLSGVTNAAGNAGTGLASSANYIVDTRGVAAPIVKITMGDRFLKMDEATTITFTFREPVTGFGLGNIGLGNKYDAFDHDAGTLGPLVAAGDGKTWTAAFKPPKNIDTASRVIVVDLRGITPTAGGAPYSPPGNTEGLFSTGPDGGYIVDTKRPTATIALPDTSLTVGEDVIVTFTFSEPVVDFTINDIEWDAASGDLSKLTPGPRDPRDLIWDPQNPDRPNPGRKTWTAIFTPKTNSAENTIRLNLDRVTDAAGNKGTGLATSGNYVINARDPAPGATIKLSDYDLKENETATVTFTFTEPVTGFTLEEDIDLSDANGTLGPLTADADGRTWRATFTPKANIRDTTNTIRVKLGGVTDSAGNPGTGQASSDNYVIDTEPDNTTTVAPPAPPPPAPRPRLSTVPLSPQGLHANSVDRDGDGTPCIVEDQGPGIPGPNGPGPMPGDGNGDGSLDSKQSAVISAIVAVSPTGASNPAGAQGSYVTLVAGSQDGKLMLDSDARLGSLVQKDAPADLPKGMEMPIGLIDFKAKPTTGHASETFSLYVDPALGVNGYWVKGNDGAWVNLASAPYGGKMVTEGDRLRLDFTIEDGGRFDADGEADGVITATGAVAQIQLSIVGQAPPDAMLKYGF